MGDFPGEPHKFSGNGSPRADELLPFIGEELRLLLSLQLKGNDTPKNWRSQSHLDYRRKTQLFLEGNGIFLSAFLISRTQVHESNGNGAHPS